MTRAPCDSARPIAWPSRRRPEPGASICLGHRDVHQFERRRVVPREHVDADDHVVVFRDARQRRPSDSLRHARATDRRRAADPTASLRDTGAGCARRAARTRSTNPRYRRAPLNGPMISRVTQPP